MAFPLAPTHEDTILRNGTTYKYDGTVKTWKKEVVATDNVKISQQASATPTDEIWIGTTIEYNALTTDPNTLYFIKEN